MRRREGTKTVLRSKHSTQYFGQDLNSLRSTWLCEVVLPTHTAGQSEADCELSNYWLNDLHFSWALPWNCPFFLQIIKRQVESYLMDKSCWRCALDTKVERAHWYDWRCPRQTLMFPFSKLWTVHQRMHTDSITEINGHSQRYGFNLPRWTNTADSHVCSA